MELGVRVLAVEVVEPDATGTISFWGGMVLMWGNSIYPVPVPMSAMDTFEEGRLMEGWRMYFMLSFQM